jgi:recombination protein RecA
VFSGKFWGGGFPLGGITEIYGPSSTGKTVVGTHVLQGVQKSGGFAILIDSEHAYNAKFAETLGINIKQLIYSDAETLEESYQTIVKMVQALRGKSDKPMFIVYDSIAASPSKVERDALLEGKDMPAEMGTRARINSQYLRNISSILKKQKVGLIIINQIRSKIGLVFGNPETTAGGGKSLEYYCLGRGDCRKRKDILDENKRILGVMLDVKNTKNKVAVPFRKAEDVELYFNKGISPTSGLLSLLEQEGRVEKTGGWYTIKSSGIKFQKNDIIKALLENPDLVDAPSREALENYIGTNNASIEESSKATEVLENESEE